MNHDKVARLRQLMRDATPRIDASPTNAEAANQAFAYFEFNTAPCLTIEQSPRARMERDIARISNWYNLSGEVARVLDKAQAWSVQALSDDAAAELQSRLLQLEQCIQHGLDPPDAPVAR